MTQPTTGQCPAVPFSPEFLLDPHTTLAYLRERQPVCPVQLPTGERVWLITRYADVRQGMSDSRLSNDPRKRRTVRPYESAPPDVEAAVTRDMLNVDPPDHSRLRRLVAEWLTAKSVVRFRDHAIAISEKLLDTFAEGTTVDLMLDYVEPFASWVAADLVGVSREFYAQFRDLAGQVVVALLKNHTDYDLMEPSRRLLEMLRQAIETKRAAPGDDLLSAMISAHNENRLSGDELTSMIHLLLIAAYEAPANLIGSGMYQLLTNREQLVQLQANPGLLPGAIDEFLRMEAPLSLAVPRHSHSPLTLSGVTIPAGEPIVFSLLSAGRDPDSRLAHGSLRVDGHSRRNLSFGWGRHYCVGANFGRIECQVAIASLLSRFPELQLAESAEVKWRSSLIVHGLERLPVAL